MFEDIESVPIMTEKGEVDDFRVKAQTLRDWSR